MYTWQSPEDIIELMKTETALGEKNARIQLELEEGNYDAVERESIRYRLARSLVNLGVMIDPTAADDSNDEA